MLAADVAPLVQAFDPSGDDSSRKSQDLVLMLLAHTGDPFSRTQFTPGHITCTGLVLHPDRNAFLIIHHDRLDRWLLPGGHVEPQDAEIWHAARREVQEETSAVLLLTPDAPLVGIDVHGIPAKRSEPYHLHHDLVFAFQAESADLAATEEVRSARWHDLAELPRDPYQIPQNIHLCARRAVVALGRSR